MSRTLLVGPPVLVVARHWSSRAGTFGGVCGPRLRVLLTRVMCLGAAGDYDGTGAAGAASVKKSPGALCIAFLLAPLPTFWTDSFCGMWQQIQMERWHTRILVSRKGPPNSSQARRERGLCSRQGTIEERERAGPCG